MKTTLSTLMATTAAATMAQAFTIDFKALVVPLGTTVTSGSPLTINVSGYGDVRFEVGGSDSLVVGTTHSNDGGTTFQNSLELDPGERVLVTFLGPQAMNVNFDIIGIDSDETATPIEIGFSGDEFQLDAIGGNGVGIAAISWDAIPEPSSSLLVLMGVGTLLFRRSRS